jgi:ribonuclease VapC
MRIVVDSSALVAIVFGEDEAERFNLALRASSGEVHLSAVSLVEATMVVEARQGPAATLDLQQLLDDVSARIEPVDQATARLAIDAWRQYGKGRHKAALNLGDCFSYALAKRLGAPLLYKGRDFSLTDLNPWRIERSSDGNGIAETRPPA